MELYGTLACAPYLVYRVGNGLILDVGFIGSVVEDDGVVGEGVVDPFLQFCLRQHGTRGVVGIAQVYHIDTVVGQRGHEIVLGSTGQIGHVAPAAVGEGSGAAYHGIGVDIDRIDGVGDSHRVVPTHYLLDVTRITLGAVVDENLRGVKVYAARGEVVLQDGFAQKVVAMLGAIAVERLLDSQVVYGAVHGFNHRWTQGLGDIAYSQTDDVGIGMGHAVGVDLLGHIGEEVIVREFQEVFVY